MKEWYLAKLVYLVKTEGAEQSPQFDEQIRLLQAHDSEEAFIKARLLGGRNEESFLNHLEQKVAWTFIDTIAIYPISNAQDGAEICSRMYETDDEHMHISYIRKKAMDLQQTLGVSGMVLQQ
jgi:hypothetical protein